MYNKYLWNYVNWIFYTYLLVNQYQIEPYLHQQIQLQVVFGRQLIVDNRASLKANFASSKFTGKLSHVVNHAWNHLLWLTTLILMVSPTSLKVYIIAYLFLVLPVIFVHFHDHVGESQVVAKNRPATACFRARILWVATIFASFLILTGYSLSVKCNPNVGIMTSKRLVAFWLWACGFTGAHQN